MNRVTGDEEFELHIGRSFAENSHRSKVGKINGASSFSCFAYDFVPDSVDESAPGLVEVGDNKHVTVHLTNHESSSNGTGPSPTHTQFEGPCRPLEKECVLMVDRVRGIVTLERLENVVQLKKTRQVINKPSLLRDKMGFEVSRPSISVSPVPPRPFETLRQRQVSETSSLSDSADWLDVPVSSALAANISPSSVARQFHSAAKDFLEDDLRLSESGSDSD